jgi:hypothetical protein
MSSSKNVTKRTGSRGDLNQLLDKENQVNITETLCQTRTADDVDVVYIKIVN